MQEDRNASNHSQPIYLGVDIAGASNTWVSALTANDGGLGVVHGPRLASLKDIVGYCEECNVVAAAIDAQLTIDLSDENGLRASDTCLQKMGNYPLDDSTAFKGIGSLNIMWWVPLTQSVPLGLSTRRASRSHRTFHSWSFSKLPFKRTELLRTTGLRFRVLLGDDRASEPEVMS